MRLAILALALEVILADITLLKINRVISKVGLHRELETNITYTTDLP
jgi:hypothetical protein